MAPLPLAFMMPETEPGPPFAAGRTPVTPVVSGRPVAFVSVTDDGVPRSSRLGSREGRCRFRQKLLRAVAQKWSQRMRQGCYSEDATRLVNVPDEFSPIFAPRGRSLLMAYAGTAISLSTTGKRFSYIFSHQNILPFVPIAVSDNEIRHYYPSYVIFVPVAFQFPLARTRLVLLLEACQPLPINDKKLLSRIQDCRIEVESERRADSLRDFYFAICV